jgi:hypothetical protein
MFFLLKLLLRKIEDPHTLIETQILTEKALLNKLQVVFYRAATKGTQNDAFRHFFDSGPPTTTSGPRYLWVQSKEITVQ